LGIRNAVSDTLLAIGSSGGDGPISAAAGMAGAGASQVLGALNPFGNNVNQTGISVGSHFRLPVMGYMRTMWANFAAQRDLEIFKRNIYPGNGTGVAQFLGGDLGDGWANAASLTPEDNPNPRLHYLDRLTDSSWNNLLRRYDSGDSAAAAAIDIANSGKESRASGGVAAGILSSSLLAAGTALAVGTGGLALPLVGGVTAAFGGATLLGSLSGRGGANIFQTLGLISTLDDDMPGFDEVSFRAQTYMKTVWDMFQLCAGLLPNYIVAVRPFEDRSTIFYGKPHWLYTSGVVPITTGFPSEKKAIELGLKTPSYRSPDAELMDLLNKINQSSNPTADYEAFRTIQSPLLSLEQIARDQSSFSDIYAPAGVLKGRVINLTDPGRLKYLDSEKKVVSEIPVNKGFVTIGFHLPITSDKGRIEVDVKDLQLVHREIPQMPLRYSFPYFTDRTSGAVLLDYPFYALSDSRDIQGATVHKGNREYEKFMQDSIYINLLDYEARLVGTTPLTDIFSDSLNDEEFTIILDALSFTNSVGENTLFSSENAIFDLEKSVTAVGNKKFVRMPLPTMKNELISNQNLEGSWEYEFINQVKITAESDFSYRSWGSPETAIDEQFYIAMKWPYDISDGDKDNDIFKKFKEKYFKDRKDDEFYGSPSEYKKRKVLVYSPITRTAVVCKPAFFMWGKDAGVERANISARSDTPPAFEDITISAVVSPDAAYYLGTMHLGPKEKIPSGGGGYRVLIGKFNNDIAEQAADTLAKAGLAPVPQPRECYFAFVNDDVPLGVVTTLYNPANEFELTEKAKEELGSDGNYVVGFGRFDASGLKDKKLLAELTNAENLYRSGGISVDTLERKIEILNTTPGSPFNSIFTELAPVGGVNLLTDGDFAEAAARGGNVLPSTNGENGYFDLVLAAQYNNLSRDELYKILDNELATTGSKNTASGRVQFAPVYDPLDETAREARSFYDEGYSATTHVIAGDGRTLADANDVWDQFRFGYHNYESVKKIFFDAFGLDPDDATPVPDAIVQIIKNPKADINFIKTYGSSDNSAVDEFTLLLGSDFINKKTPEYYVTPYGASVKKDANNQIIMNKQVEEAIEYARKNLIDASLDQGGLIKYFNSLINSKYRNLGKFFQNASNVSLIVGQTIGGGLVKTSDILNKTQSNQLSAKQVFLLIVGLFRQAMWQDSYARAWLVLKPSRKILIRTLFSGGDEWDFHAVDKIFAAFIDPNQNYSSDKKKFLKLLADNKGEGNSASNFIGVLANNIDNFWDANVGPLFTALSDGLSGLMNMFRISMMQMGYQLSEIDNFAKQANILNKVLNDSIYYSMGRPGSILRAVDNPFTREYGEPVVEVREPFQRMHYLSSFSTILNNNIQETTTNVATSVTAVSDGKYPVTVALDKSIPSERQIEKTVETGLYFDNLFGSGLTGLIHPIVNPIEFSRSAIKTTQGAPDELMARRVALAHLKESLKDIYSGELIVLGSSDIRPHDLVYLADVYERMYGIFEVEQVVHHFTPNMGFVTSITPNAFVTVNDPARWFMSSWMHSWFSIQNIRNDTRMIMNSVQAGSTGILSNGNISVDGVAQSLRVQMLGGVQFTHGSSALSKDIMANFTAEGLFDARSQVEKQLKANADAKVSLSGLAAMYATTTLGSAVIGSLVGGPIGAGIAAAASTDLMWKGWKWVRDNVLDQHGCYISYLNRNGQPMDAGLSINQGMVVGRYHTKRLLPGILGVRTKVRNVNGNAFIRYDDILKNMGWKENQITDLVRYVSIENALVNAEVLKYSGTGPDKAGFNQFFKILCKLNKVIDGDEIEVIDLLNPQAPAFKVRLEGIIASKMGVFQGYVNTSTSSNPIQGINIDSPGGKAAQFVYDKLSQTPFVIRVSPNDLSSASMYTEDDLEPGSKINNTRSYLKGKYYGDSEAQKSLGTVFYRIIDTDVQDKILFIRGLFLQNANQSSDQIKEKYKETLFPDSIFWKKFNVIYSSIFNSNVKEYFEVTGSSDPLINLSNNKIKTFNVLVSLRIIESLYSKASEWPYVGWDEYYDDGGPATLNWELVTNNLAQVYTVDLLRSRPAEIGLDDQIPNVQYIEQRSN
jgi:hypothetical protein